MLSLLFNTLDECLFLFCSEGIIVKDVKIATMNRDDFRLTLAWCASFCVDCMFSILIGCFTSNCGPVKEKSSISRSTNRWRL
jgi:hypothetical protein